MTLGNFLGKMSSRHRSIVPMIFRSHNQLYISFIIFGILQYISLKNWHISKRNFIPHVSSDLPQFSPNVADWQAHLKIYIPEGFANFQPSRIYVIIRRQVAFVTFALLAIKAVNWPFTVAQFSRSMYKGIIKLQLGCSPHIP